MRRYALILAIALQAAAQDPGISHELAQSRAARVSNLRYDLQLTLAPHAETLPGHETATFQLNDTNQDLAIDYREGKLLTAKLNGTNIPTDETNGHLILPAKLLQPNNTLETTFSSRIAKAGAAITRYEDKEDNSEYFYSLFVPMDADMAFPCFDQPDIKAKFTLDVGTWLDPNITVIANGRPLETPASVNGQQIHHRFEETKPISTYLFAFAAGPWAKLAGKPGEPDLYVRKSQLTRAQNEAPHVQEMTARGIKFLSNYFQQPFPFPKYDLVLIPGFPFGGMEHAGATFLNETGVLFRSAPTAADRFTRDTLTLHELTHQWFGDLVTMRWFNDLWLKEGFAQFMSYRALQELDPGSQPWKHLYEDIKPLAYGIDETEGTTPIFQTIPNLKDAKSAYGAIVYQKAPSILRQLQYKLGDDAFRDGLRLYLQAHAYNNAEWSDLVSALQTASKQDLQPWAKAWVVQRGMPQITTSFTCTNGKLANLTLSQTDVLPDHYTWPITNEVLLAYPNAEPQHLRVDWSTAQHTVAEAKGKPCPSYVFANSNDYAYGRFLLDSRSEASVKQTLGSTTQPEPLLRSMLWGSLWEDVHTANSAPSGYVALALKDLPTQNDETLARIQYGRTNTALQRYITGPKRAPFITQIETISTDRMLHAPTLGLRINSFRALTASAETETARGTLKSILAGQTKIPEVDLRPLDRWNIIGHLIATDDPDAPKLLAAESKSDTTDDGRKYAFAVQAGAPAAATKKSYFTSYTTPANAPTALQEDWLSQSIGPFNNVRQSALTLPYLQLALDQLPNIKRDRKIFYLGVWLGGFLGGQTSAEAQTIVHQWLTQPSIDPDLRRKVLENADPLERAVKIRAKFPE